MNMLHQRRADVMTTNEIKESISNGFPSLKYKPIPSDDDDDSTTKPETDNGKKNNAPLHQQKPYPPQKQVDRKSDASSDYDFYTDEEYETESEEGSHDGMLRAVPAIENIVMGRETTVIDEEHQEPLRKKKNASFGCVMALAEDQNPNPNQKEKIRSIWNRSRFRMLFVGSSFVLLLTLRVGRSREHLREIHHLRPSSSAWGATYHSAWGGTYTYYGHATVPSGENENTEHLDSYYGLVFPGTSPPPDIQLPATLENLADVNAPTKETDIPLFWHVPRSGGGTMKDAMGFCLGKVQASDAGGRDGLSEDKNLKIVELSNGKYVNVDTSTLHGIQHAKSLDLAQSNLPDVIISLFLHDVSTIFTPTNQGRLFTLLRHPVDRAVSLFYYITWAHWEKTYDPQLASMTLEQYASMPRLEYNWMTRFLTGQLRGPLGTHHLDLAKEVLRRKCLIGLLERKEESLKRFETYLNWMDQTDKQRQCVRKIMFETWSNKHDHAKIDRGSKEWELLEKRNHFDMELYEYAKVLFNDQATFFQ